MKKILVFLLFFTMSFCIDARSASIMDSLNTSKDFTMDVNQSFYETNMIYKRGKALDSFVQTERDRQYYNAISKCIERGGNSTDTATALQEQINFLQKLVIDQQATINRLISK